MPGRPHLAVLMLVLMLVLRPLPAAAAAAGAVQQAPRRNGAVRAVAGRHLS